MQSAYAVKLRSLVLLGGSLISVDVWSHECRAAKTEEAKLACVGAADQGQLLRDAGQYSSAREQFTRCSSEDCPPVVRERCAAWLAQVGNLTPTVVFAASDGDGKDLAAVDVFSEGRRLAERLDGRPIELDPGSHEIRFQAPGHAAAVVNVMLRAGDKNRAISVTLPDLHAGDLRRTLLVAPSPPSTSPWDARPFISVGLLATGALAAATGLYFAVRSQNAADEAASLRQGLNRGSCAEGTAPSCRSLSHTVDIQRQDFIASGVFYGLGGAMATAALTTWIVWSQKPDRRSPTTALILQPALGPAFAGLRAEVTLR